MLKRLLWLHPYFLLSVINECWLLSARVKRRQSSSRSHENQIGCGSSLSERLFELWFYLEKLDPQPSLQIYIFIFTAGGCRYWLEFSPHSGIQKHKYHIEVAESGGWMRSKATMQRLHLRWKAGVWLIDEASQSQNNEDPTIPHTAYSRFKIYHDPIALWSLSLSAL